jgi:omega-6 fatty acid desaturase (delta-12 desaturase)
LFTIRIFVLMHDCGHRSLFRTPMLNRHAGFILGVVAGVPQAVWSKRHLHHHVANGNWDRFRGVLDILSVDEYAALDDWRRWRYRRIRHAVFAPYGGFIYMVFRPFWAWAKGSCDLLWHLATAKLREPYVSLSEHAQAFRTRYWRSLADYSDLCRHHLVSLIVWVGMCLAIGPMQFLSIHIASLTLTGAVMILLVHSQHNFEHAYASDDANWDPMSATLEGTSFLVLPRWLRWFTADSGYHHVHHLSAAIPNYRLAACHERHADLFAGVKRLRLADVPGTLRCILWDTHAQKITSMAEYEQRNRADRLPGLFRIRRHYKLRSVRSTPARESGPQPGSWMQISAVRFARNYCAQQDSKSAGSGLITHD